MEKSDPVLVDLTEEVKKLHADFVTEIHKRELSSSENFDKSVLTFSSGGLALSVGFLKDFVPIQTATLPWALYSSWALFTLATCLTMASFLVSSRALADQKKLAYSFYIERDEEAFNRKNSWNFATQFLNYFSGGAFLLAMILTVVFISINLEKGNAMKQTANSVNPTSQHTSQPGLLQKGLTVPTLQQVPKPVQATVPASQPVASSPTGPTSTPSSK
ncbi:MAG: hypothetical protein PSV24_11075 [Rhodoferax sp.]|nr:hypothetical protein [Rhodoferax sp.]